MAAPSLVPSEAFLFPEVRPVSSLSSRERLEMCRLLSRYFEGTIGEHFERDLDEKDAVLLLRASENGAIVGFTTVMWLRAEIDGERLVAIYLGDTIVEQYAWGESAFPRLCCQQIWELRQTIPSQKVYLFALCCGFRTYRFFPAFFREFYPSINATVSNRLQRTLHTLASLKFGQQYDVTTGVVYFDHPTPLRCGVSEITSRELADSHVAYFLERNRGHVVGDGLACIAEVTSENLSRLAQRICVRSS
jgi:hypothetical protein